MNTRLISVFICLLLCACSRKDQYAPLEPEEPGTMSARVNQQPFSATERGAVYYTRERILVVGGRNPALEFVFGVMLDTLAPLRDYTFTANSFNDVFATTTDVYSSDQNVAGTGGGFALTRFDSVSHLLSGRFHFVNFNADRSAQLVFEEGVINDIRLRLDTGTYHPSRLSYRVNGVSQTDVSTDRIDAFEACTDQQGNPLSIEIWARSALANYTRRLKLWLPLNLIPGTYPINRETPFDNACLAGGVISAQYYLHDLDHRYETTTGSITLTEMNLATRTIRGSFELTVHDDVLNETIVFTQGVIDVHGWRHQ